jgi:hypothetical protein
MNTTTNLKTTKAPSPAVRPRRGGWIGLLIAALILGAGGYALWKYVTDPPQPWLVRWRVQRYLKQQTHTGDFRVDFPFPSKAEMAQASPKAKDKAGAAKGSQTGKDFETLRNEYFALKSSALVLQRDQARSNDELRESSARLDVLSKQLAAARTDATATNAIALQAAVTAVQERVSALQKKASSRPELQAKEQALAPIVNDLWEYQREWRAEEEAAGPSGAKHLAEARTQFTADIRQKLEQAASYSEMYRLIAQEIWVADRLLASANADHRRAGVTLALAASHQAIDDAQNGWVAARICEGYVQPNLDLADDKSRRSSFNPDNLLNECAEIFRRSGEYPNVARTYELALARATTPQQSDAVRAQLAMAYEQAGDARHAVKYLRQIQNTNDYRGALRRLPRLEQQAKK